MNMVHLLRHAVLCFLLVSNQISNAGTEIEISVPSTVLDGAELNVEITGLNPGESIRIHAVRVLEQWQSVDNEWALVPVRLHAWAAYDADDQGRVYLPDSPAIEGMALGTDTRALLRNGRRAGHALLETTTDLDLFAPSSPSNEVHLSIERDSMIVARASFELVQSLIEVEHEIVAQPHIHGVYAVPVGIESPPVVLVLHGSEGGSVAKARAAATRFAAQGYAALAINYFARAFEGIEGLRTDHIEVPIETIAHAREWVAAQGTADTDRIAIWGHSKGAEFALLAASHYDWIDAVIAVSPSDIVWEGYTDNAGTGASSSSWSLDSQPIPFVPLFEFNPEHQGVYRTNTERYNRSRAYHADQISGSRIPVERINAQTLLLAGDRDSVWAAGDMTRNIVERMIEAGNEHLVNVRIYPLAGHQISSTGTFPVFLYGAQSDDPRVKDIEQEGSDSADAWELTLQLLDRALRE